MSISSPPLRSLYVLLTGASRGLGAQIAREICKAGGRVWLVARNQDALKDLCEDLNQNTSGSAHWSSVDLSQTHHVTTWLNAHQEELLKLTSIIHNAGIDDFKAFTQHSFQSLEDQVHLNLLAPLLINRACIESLSQKIDASPSIIHMSSLAGYFPLPFGSPYSATKSALWQMNESLAIEYAQSPIRWISLHPGFVNGVGMHERHKESAGKAPIVLGGTTDHKVVQAVIHALIKGEGPRIINRSPVRPFLALLLSFPLLYRRLARFLMLPYLKKIAHSSSEAIKNKDL